MITAALAALLAWLFFSNWSVTKDYGIDLPAAVTVFPALLIFLAGLAIGFSGLFVLAIPVSLAILVIAPLCVLKFLYELSWKHTAIGTVVAVLATIVSQLIVGLLLNAANGA